MNLKTYRAKTMADALSAVKQDLGDDAYILHTRTHKVGGVLGMLGRTIVEITASDAPPRRRKMSQPRAASRVAPRPAAAAASRAYASTTAVRTDTPTPKPRLSGSMPHAQHRPEPPTHPTTARARMVEPDLPRPPQAPTRQPPSRVEAEPQRMSVHRTGHPNLDRIKPSVEEEIATVKRMLAQVLHRANVAAISASGVAAVPGVQGAVGTSPQVGRMSDALSDHYLRLLESMVASEIADEVIGAVRDELSPAELADADIVRQTVLRHLADMIHTSQSVPKAGRCEDGRPMTIALIGPTGVGKTTTVAKLAASYKLRHGRRVGLITSDTYRIAAVDQLRMYADIIGVPLKVATTPQDMATAVESFRDHDVILIDSAGRSQRDRERISELAALMDAARPHETHLVLAGNGNESVLLDAVESFSAASPNRVIFTKLDEAVNFGVLLNVARRVSLKLSYVTTGQEVPDHIEASRPDRIARLILEGPQVAVGAGAGAGAGAGMGRASARRSDVPGMGAEMVAGMGAGAIIA